ncbi:DUF533 domain-containing protein [Gemmobacter denitrificans]|uniref:DUF533 domain-containing protein n=1 Tax=Gemmobacter denitrificans TaxID=3123040 RepID=A0ABU8BSE4_9RHOB
MSLVKTLAKVAIGVAVAKGVSHLAKNGLPGMGQTGATRSAGRGTQIGGAGDLLGQLGGMLGGGKGASAGGLGGLLDGLTGGGTASRSRSRQNAPSGLEAMLGGAGGGNLADMLGGLLGGGAAAGGLGGMLTDALQGGTPAQPSRDQELAAALMLRAMIQAAKCDGALDEAEKQKLMQALDGADQAELDFVNAELSAPLDIDGLARQVPQGMEEQVYMVSLSAIDLDNRNEAQYLHGLAQALDLTPDEVNRLHDQAGAARIYG